jgi:GntR family transcriptional regulator/MocR family aminotransferase
VTYAYEQLLAEGYLESRTGAGTFVADTAPDQIPEAVERKEPLTDPSGKSELSARGALLTRQAGVGERQWGAFMPGVPDVTCVPHKIWGRLQNKHWRRSNSDLLTYGRAPVMPACASRSPNTCGWRARSIARPRRC